MAALDYRKRRRDAMGGTRVSNDQRDDFTRANKQLLADRAGHRCSNPHCQKLTTGPHSDADKRVSIGVAAHITAAQEGGPLFDPNLTTRQRKAIENGVWLCQSCSVLIDRDPTKYSLEVRRDWKLRGEAAASAEMDGLVNEPPDEAVPIPAEAAHLPVPAATKENIVEFLGRDPCAHGAQLEFLAEDPPGWLDGTGSAAHSFLAHISIGHGHNSASNFLAAAAERDSTNSGFYLTLRAVRCSTSLDEVEESYQDTQFFRIARAVGDSDSQAIRTIASTESLDLDGIDGPHIAVLVANAHFEVGDYSTAAKVLSACLGTHPHSGEVKLGLARSLASGVEHRQSSNSVADLVRARDLSIEVALERRSWCGPSADALVVVMSVCTQLGDNETLETLRLGQTDRELAHSQLVLVSLGSGLLPEDSELQSEGLTALNRAIYSAQRGDEEAVELAQRALGSLLMTSWMPQSACYHSWAWSICPDLTRLCMSTGKSNWSHRLKSDLVTRQQRLHGCGRWLHAAVPQRNCSSTLIA